MLTTAYKTNMKAEQTLATTYPDDNTNY